MVSPDNITVSNIKSLPGGNSIFLGAKITKVDSFFHARSVSVPFLILFRKSNTRKATGVIAANHPVSCIYLYGYIAEIFNSIVLFVSVNVVNKFRLGSIMDYPSTFMSKVNFAKYFCVEIAASVFCSKSLFSAKFSSPFRVRPFATFKKIISSWLISKRPRHSVVQKQTSKKFRIVESMSHNLSFFYPIRYRSIVTECIAGVKIDA